MRGLAERFPEYGVEGEVYVTAPGAEIEEGHPLGSAQVVAERHPRLEGAIVGHVGDGNFHTVLMVPPETDGLDRAWALDRKSVGRALALGGSCSGEHGVGIGKREFHLE